MNKIFKLARIGVIAQFLLPTLIILSTSCSKGQKQIPIIFKVSESVAPGKLLSLYGNGIPENAEIQFFSNNGRIIAKRKCIQVDSMGQFCRVVFPDIDPGVYSIKLLGLDNSTSVNNNNPKKIYVNRPSPRWISEERAYPGMKMKLFGRNLDASAYNGKQDTEIKLNPVNVGIPVIIIPDKVTPYVLDFTIPKQIMNNDYFVEVRTNSAAFGSDWIRLNDASEYPAVVSDIVLTVENEPVDPTARGLGVAWANDFDWRSVYNVKTQFGVKGDGISDDTKALQEAIDFVAKKGGGVVFLPDGTYNISGLQLDKNVIFKGESNTKTIISYLNNIDWVGDKSNYFYKKNNIRTNNIFESKGDILDSTSAKRVGLHGICNIKVIVNPKQNKNKTMSFCYLGGGRKIDPLDREKLTASRIFVYNCNVELGLESAYWDAFNFAGAGPILVANNKFITGNPSWSHGVKEYFIIRDNTIDFVNKELSVSSDKLLLFNNKLTGKLREGITTTLHGVFTNEGVYGFNMWNNYIGNNEVNDLNYLPGNDGEVICVDAHHWYFTGIVTDASDNHVEIKIAYLNKPKRFTQKTDFTEEQMAVICGGKGLGQLRRVTGHSRPEGSSDIWTIKIESAWDVIPDSTSRISIGRFHTGVIVENNSSSNCTNSILFYHGGIDNIIASNNLNNTRGIEISGRFLKNQTPQSGRPGMSYFNDVKYNTVTGKSVKFNTAWIGERGEDKLRSFQGVSLYGNEFRSNQIDRTNCYDKKDRRSRAPSAFVSSQADGFSEGRLNLAPLFEGNIVLNSLIGISINDGAVYGAIINDTKTTNVDQKILDRGFSTVVVSNE